MESAVPPSSIPNSSLGFVITSTCENPEAAMQLINFMFTKEGDELLLSGRVGRDVEMGG